MIGKTFSIETDLIEEETVQEMKILCRAGIKNAILDSVTPEELFQELDALFTAATIRKKTDMCGLKSIISAACYPHLCVKFENWFQIYGCHFISITKSFSLLLSE